jgi:hypothetical protein
MNALMVDLHIAQGDFQVAFQEVEAIEDAIVERLLAQIIPEMLNRIELWRVRRQFE